MWCALVLVAQIRAEHWLTNGRSSCKATCLLSHRSCCDPEPGTVHPVRCAARLRVTVWEHIEPLTASVGLQRILSDTLSKLLHKCWLLTTANCCWLP